LLEKRVRPPAVSGTLFQTRGRLAVGAIRKAQGKRRSIDMATFTGKVALITGANKGIGFEIARKLGKQGITVLVGARDLDKGVPAVETLKNEGIDAQAVKIDVTDEKSIEEARNFVEQRFGKLDILVNNAGVLPDGEQTASTIPLEMLRQVFETNVFGVVAVTQSFLPLLRNSPAGRVVNLTSSLGSLTLNADPKSPMYATKYPAYNTSKAALNMITVHFAYELRDTPIKVNAACPGWVRTDMGGPSAPGTAEQGADTPTWLATLPADGPTGGFFNSRKPVPW
jgi:NAD(P)-dependent dehydrogenase (short-subunit alcohol dehydrogenase family)